jgi:transposase
MKTIDMGNGFLDSMCIWTREGNRMPRYKHTDTAQTLMVPVRLSDQLIPGTFEHALNQIVDERIDLSELGRRWYSNDVCGASAYHPGCLLKVVLLGYSKGLYSSRRIAWACRSNTAFMAISGDSHPHFTTIACFVRSLEEEVLGIFCTILLICSELDLIGGEVFAVDGCKIRSNASKEWSGTFEELARKREKIRQKVKLMMDSHAREDRRERRRGREEGRFSARVARQKRAIERIDAFLAANEPKPGKDRKELQSNITDNESAKLHSSHGMIQGYNGLAMVDGKRQIIVAAEPVSSVHEGEHLAEVLDQAEQNAASAGMGEKALEGAGLLVDTSYYSEENIKLCDERRMDAYIPDSQFRSRDPRFPRTNRRREHKGLFAQDRFRFDAKRKVYVCPNGKQLKLNAKGVRVGGFEGWRYEARKQDCQSCPLKAQCLKKGARRRKLYIVERRVGRDWLGEMRKKIDSRRGRAAYARRMGIVEPVFGNITVAKRLDRFTLRGRGKVRVQWMMYAMVHNIEKIAHYGKRAGPPRKKG